ncbi:helix-turn-helix domain-containing protein [Streptomyces sp. NPDC005953]|uniref:TetR/AcrR family transcriptional regulator n=1 Tax=Streptomyces sp. NPDC005953 TaxID=3156719 RepID=UPI0033F965BE
MNIGGGRRSTGRSRTRRTELLAIGRTLFARTSYDALSMDDIARSTGVAKGLLYYYFGSKRGYYLAVIEDSVADLLTRLLRATPATIEQSEPSRPQPEPEASDTGPSALRSMGIGAVQQSGPQAEFASRAARHRGSACRASQTRRDETDMAQGGSRRLPARGRFRGRSLRPVSTAGVRPTRRYGGGRGSGVGSPSARHSAHRADRPTLCG